MGNHTHTLRLIWLNKIRRFQFRHDYDFVWFSLRCASVSQLPSSSLPVPTLAQLLHIAPFQFHFISPPRIMIISHCKAKGEVIFLSTFFSFILLCFQFSSFYHMHAMSERNVAPVSDKVFVNRNLEKLSDNLSLHLLCVLSGWRRGNFIVHYVKVKRKQQRKKAKCICFAIYSLCVPFLFDVTARIACTQNTYGSEAYTRLNNVSPGPQPNNIRFEVQRLCVKHKPMRYSFNASTNERPCVCVLRVLTPNGEVWLYCCRFVYVILLCVFLVVVFFVFRFVIFTRLRCRC